MNCEDTRDKLYALGRGELPELERRQLFHHVGDCDDCQAVMQAVHGLRDLRRQPAEEPPPGLFERSMERARREGGTTERHDGFWRGAGIGAALAASLMVAVWSLGVVPESPAPVTQPVVALSPGEPRDVNIAIDMDQRLAGAAITVQLTDGIEIDGYPGRRELSWTTDLEAGTNKLTLPVIASDTRGGALLVRVGHGGRERRFTVELPVG